MSTSHSLHMYMNSRCQPLHNAVSGLLTVISMCIIIHSLFIIAVEFMDEVCMHQVEKHLALRNPVSPHAFYTLVETSGSHNQHDKEVSMLPCVRMYMYDILCKTYSTILGTYSEWHTVLCAHNNNIPCVQARLRVTVLLLMHTEVGWFSGSCAVQRNHRRRHGGP